MRFLLGFKIPVTGLPRVDLESSGGFQAVLATVLQTVFAVAAGMAVIFIIIGGIKYTVSGGDPAGISKAKDTILYAVIGLIIAIFAFAIVNFALR